MRRSRRRTRKRSRRQRGGFLDALKAGLNNGLGMFGLKKEERPAATATPTTHASAEFPQLEQVGGKRRRRKSRRRKSRRRKSRRRKSRRRKSRRKRRRRTKRRR